MKTYNVLSSNKKKFNRYLSFTLSLVFSALLQGCGIQTVDPTGIFNPPSGSNIIYEPSEVSINTGNAVVTCYTIDNTKPKSMNGACTAGLPVLDGKVTLSKCGSQNLILAWEEKGTAGNTLSYTTSGEFRVSTIKCNALSDEDKDGTPDYTDNCPRIFNPDQRDVDGDGKGDVCDALPFDGDNDGIDDAEDNCPNNDNANQTDTDADGLGDVCDPTPRGSDTDSDGLIDVQDNCPAVKNVDQADLDRDGLGDACDDDDDNDTIQDSQDNCPLHPNTNQFDIDKDGKGDVCDGTPNGDDKDGDGKLDIQDNCPLIANPDQKDFDKDGLGDACDPDDDNDKINDVADNCPFLANLDQKDLDKDGLGDVCDNDNDDDGDQVADTNDNCPLIANPMQADGDQDKIGDACDSLHGNTTLSTDKAVYAPGQSITVKYYEGSGSNRDWIGIYKVGTTKPSCTRNSTYVTYKYTNGTSGSLTFAGLSAGSYVLQLFANDDYCYIGTALNITVK